MLLVSQVTGGLKIDYGIQQRGFHWWLLWKLFLCNDEGKTINGVDPRECFWGILLQSYKVRWGLEESREVCVCLFVLIMKVTRYFYVIEDDLGERKKLIM